jgi:hypothetical protein
MPGGARDIHADLEADWARLGQEALRAFGLSPGDRGELFERYGQGSGLTEEDVMRAPPRHLLDEARRIQISMEADPEAARGAALMAMSSAPDLEAARKSAPAAEAEPDASRKFATSPAIPVSLGPMQGAPQSPNVNVNGSAQVEQTFHIDVSLSPGMQAQLDQISSTFGFSVPLSAPTGTMDTDAAPRRGIAIMNTTMTPSEVARRERAYADLELFLMRLSGPPFSCATATKLSTVVQTPPHLCWITFHNLRSIIHPLEACHFY